MRRLGKVLLIVVGVALVLMLLGMGTVIFVSKQRQERIYNVRPRPVKVPTEASALVEGKRLFHARGCAECHGNDATGKIVVDAAIGKFVATNLTQVLPDRTDEDLVRAVRHGVSKDGHALMLMPSNEYFGMSDRDMGHLIAYMRTFKPAEGIAERCEPRPLGRMLHVAGVLNVFPAEKIPHEQAPTAPDPGDTIEFGGYLAVGCIGCHGEGYSGGPIPGAPPELGNPSNLTPHESGMKSWTKEDFVRALREGKRPDGSAINPKQMPWTALSYMSDLEISALWRYLQQLPPKPRGQR